MKYILQRKFAFSFELFLFSRIFDLRQKVLSLDKEKKNVFFFCIVLT